MLTFVE